MSPHVIFRSAGQVGAGCFLEAGTQRHKGQWGSYSTVKKEHIVLDALHSSWITV